MPGSSPAPAGAPPPLDFSNQAVPVPTNVPLDFSKQAIPLPKGLDFSAQAVPVTAPQPGNPLSSKIQTAIAAGWRPTDILNYLSQSGNYRDQIAQARMAGYGDADILKYMGDMAPPPAPTSNSPVDAFRNAAGDIVSGVGKLGGDIDSAIQSNAPAWLAKATGATSDLQSGADNAVVNTGQAISGPNQYQPAPVHQLGDDIEDGKPMAALNDAAGVVAGAVPYAATAMIPGAGPLVLGASAAGNTINSRMQAEGETSPSAGDALAGAADGFVNTFGGGAAHGVLDGVGRAALSPLATRALGPLAGRYIGRVATNAAAGGAVGAANSIATNAGTGNLTAGGVLNDAEEGAGTGGLAGAVMQAPQARADAATSRAVSAMDPEQAASVVRVAGDAASRLQGAKAAGIEISPVTAIKALGEQLQGELNAHVTRLGQSGDLSTADRQAVIQPLLAAAKAGTLHPGEATIPGTPLSQLSTIGLDADDAALLRNGLIDLSTINRDGASSGGVLRPLVSHFVNSGAAKAAEAIGGGVLGFTHGGLPGAVIGGVTGLLAPRVTSAIAGGADTLIGANTPSLMRQQATAQAALQRAGLTAGPSSLAALQAARQAMAGGSANDTPEPAVIGAARAAQNQAGMVAKLGPDHPVGAAALASLRAAGRNDLADQATAQWQAMSGIRDASAAGAAHDTAARHQQRLDAANETPGGLFGIDAINAATRELNSKAQATMRAAGAASGGQSGGPGQGLGVAQSEAGSGVAGKAVASPGAVPESSSGVSGDRRIGLPDYLHLVALTSPSGVSLDPSDMARGVDAAAAAGQLTPDQHAFYTDALASGAPLDNPAGLHNTNLSAILNHAIAGKTGGDAAAAAGLLLAGPRGFTAAAGGNGAARTDVRDVVRYGEAAKSNRAAYLNAATVAGAENRPALAKAALHALATPDAVARKALFDGLDPNDQARARELLNPALLGETK